MLLYFCDNCGCPVAADVARMHQERGNNVRLLCKECSHIRSASGECVCDRCGNRFSDQALRQGEALVVVGSAKKPWSDLLQKMSQILSPPGASPRYSQFNVTIFIAADHTCGYCPYFAIIITPERSASRPPTLPIDELLRQIDAKMRQQLQEFESKLVKKWPPRQKPVIQSPPPTPVARDQKQFNEIPQLLARKAIEKCAGKLQKGDPLEKLARDSKNRALQRKSRSDVFIGCPR